MKLVKGVSFDEVVHAWLRSEWDKHGYSRDYLAQKSKFIDKPDFKNKNDNSERLQLLRQARYLIVDPLPSNTVWSMANFELDDIDNLYVVPSGDINTPDWLPISNSSFKMSACIDNFHSSLEHAEWIRNIYQILPNEDLDTRLIIVASNKNGPFTIIEGNHRGVALIKYLLDYPEDKPLLKEIYLGTSLDMKQYIWHIESRLIH